MRLRKIKNAGLQLAKHPELVIPNPEIHRGKWKKLFNNNNPIHLELGMGKGQFIIKMATLNPDINFIGIERFDSVILQAMKKALGVKLPNLRLIHFDGARLLDIFEEHEIEKIYLNFSDPWPKSRHAKRRLTYPAFLEIYRKVLVEGGEIEFKTDNVHLFEYSIISFNNNDFIFEDFSVDLHARDEEIVTTEYEDRFLARNQPIYFVKVKLKGVK